MVLGQITASTDNYPEFAKRILTSGLNVKASVDIARYFAYVEHMDAHIGSDGYPAFVFLTRYEDVIGRAIKEHAIGFLRLVLEVSRSFPMNEVNASSVIEYNDQSRNTIKNIRNGYFFLHESKIPGNVMTFIIKAGNVLVFREVKDIIELEDRHLRMVMQSRDLREFRWYLGLPTDAEDILGFYRRR